MRLTLTMFLSLDAVYQAPGQPGEDRSGGCEQGAEARRRNDRRPV